MAAQVFRVGTKSGRYRIISGIIVSSGIVAAMMSLVGAVTTATGRTLVALGGADPRLPLEALHLLNQAELAERGTGTMVDLEVSMRLIAAAPLLVQAALFAVAAIALVRIVAGISRGDAFSGRVQAGWRMLVWALLGGGLLQGVLNTIGSVYFASRIGLLFGVGKVSPEERNAFLGGDYSVISYRLPDWPVTIIIAGLVALALTAAFRMGARLEREADGVV